MRITKFWAKGYRSLKDVTLDPLGPFNIFYGPNGSGKSNVLAAIEALFDALRVINREGTADLLRPLGEAPVARQALERGAGDFAFAQSVFSASDFRIDAMDRSITLGAAIELDRLVVENDDPRRLNVEVRIEEAHPGEPRLRLTSLSVNGVTPPALLAGDGLGIDALRTTLAEACAGFSFVAADRSPRREPYLGGQVVDPVRSHLRAGRIKNALLAASTSTDAGMRRRLRAFRAIVQGPPLNRPPFDAVLDTATQEVDVREPLGSGDVSIDRVGLGVAQMYGCLAGVVLCGGDAVALEEPEAHLHAPTLGRQLRKLLLRTVRESYIDQLFIATHSNLFDLDPDGYWDVSMVDGETRVVRKPLHEIDLHHLWETGPTRHALMLMLRYAPADKVVFAHADGRPITAGQMLQYLRDDDEVTKRFLANLHGAALDMMRIAADREPKA
jgi:hypothetical protein